jgi:hypothetical protein
MMHTERRENVMVRLCSLRLPRPWKLVEPTLAVDVGPVSASGPSQAVQSSFASIQWLDS